jgi:hypothetical protein
MQQISINTPALLFPAITLMMLAYTNRFLALATLIRNLHAQYKQVRETGMLLSRRLQILAAGSSWSSKCRPQES